MIDIHEPVFEICRRLGLEPTTVAHIDLRPRHVTVITYAQNEHRSPYTENGEVVTETHEFEVTT